MLILETQVAVCLIIFCSSEQRKPVPFVLYILDIRNYYAINLCISINHILRNKNIYKVKKVILYCKVEYASCLKVKLCLICLHLEANFTMLLILMSIMWKLVGKLDVPEHILSTNLDVGRTVFSLLDRVFARGTCCHSSSVKATFGT